jgi:hypothetical protein
MSADGGHFGCYGQFSQISQGIFIYVLYHAMFALNWLTGFRGQIF